MIASVFTITNGYCAVSAILCGVLAATGSVPYPYTGPGNPKVYRAAGALLLLVTLPFFAYKLA